MMNLKEIKGNIIDLAINDFLNNSEYRKSDLLDYMCDNMELDNKWDKLIDEIVLKEHNKKIEELYDYIDISKVSKLLTNKIKEIFFEKLKEKL